jgi:hypothetical protein
VGDQTPGDADLILAEDDWRQFELVSRAFAGDSGAEIAAIRAIHEKESAGVGWRKIHARKRPDPPIASTLDREDIDEACGGVTFRGVCFENWPIAAGFSFSSGNLKCYGIDEDGRVSVLGIAQVGAEDEAVEALAWLAHVFDLELIHWCRCLRVAWDDQLFRQMLTGG